MLSIILVLIIKSITRDGALCRVLVIRVGWIFLNKSRHHVMISPSLDTKVTNVAYFF